MSHKNVEASREIRLWFSQIIIPVAGIASGLMAVPEIRNATVNKIQSIKESIKKRKNIKG